MKNKSNKKEESEGNQVTGKEMTDLEMWEDMIDYEESLFANFGEGPNKDFRTDAGKKAATKESKNR